MPLKLLHASELPLHAAAAQSLLRFSVHVGAQVKSKIAQAIASQEGLVFAVPATRCLCLGPFSLFVALQGLLRVRKLCRGCVRSKGHY